MKVFEHTRLKKLLLLCFFGLISLIAEAQKPFEGRIVYKVTYLDIPDGAEGVEASLPHIMVAYVSGKNLRIEQPSILAGQLVWIQPDPLDSIYQCFTFMDRRVMLVESVKPSAKRFRVVERDKTKELFGMKLTQFHLQAADGNHFEAWVNKHYQNPFQFELFELDYLPLELDLMRNNIKMHLSAERVIEEPLDNTYFKFPANTERISDQMLLKLMK